MAHRMNISQFGRQYPHETTTGRCYEPMMQGGNNFFPQFGQQQNQYGNSTEWNQPPSWADLQSNETNVFRATNTPRHYSEPPKTLQQAQPWGQTPNQQQSKDDVFSTMGHWTPARNANRYPNNQFQQPPPPIPTPVQKEDVFENIGAWDSSMAPKRVASPMSIDLSAPTPLPSFPSYPNHRTNSFESATTSPTASLASSEEKEKNSWKTIEALINPSRSPSVAEEIEIFFPVNADGFWNSNLYN